MEKKYYIDNVYVPPGGACKGVNYCHIGHATVDMEESDGDNWIGTGGCAKFNLKTSLYDAIHDAGFIADKIEFIGLSQEELKKAESIVEQLMNDKDYLKKFGR